MRTAPVASREILGALVCAALAHPLVAAEPPPGKITVNGTGTAEVKPDVAEIHTAVTGNATMAADAIKKFRENRRRAFELLHKLDIKGLGIEAKGPVITSIAANNNQQADRVFFNFNVNGAGQANPQAAGMNCNESLVVRLPQIDRMKHEDVVDAVVKVLDACKDAGMTVSSVQFKSTQMNANKTAAVRAAAAAARQKAELLASLSHARVGPVVSIQEAPVASGTNDNTLQQAFEGEENGTLNGLNIQVSSSSPLTSIVIRASVNVEFALERSN